MSTNKPRWRRVGLGLLALAVVTLIAPAVPLGLEDSLWRLPWFYIFVASSLASPFVLGLAKKSGDRIAGYAYTASWVLVGLVVLVMAILLS